MYFISRFPESLTLWLQIGQNSCYSPLRDCRFLFFMPVKLKHSFVIYAQFFRILFVMYLLQLHWSFPLIQNSSFPSSGVLRSVSNPGGFCFLWLEIIVTSDRISSKYKHVVLCIASCAFWRHLSVIISTIISTTNKWYLYYIKFCCQCVIVVFTFGAILNKVAACLPFATSYIMEPCLSFHFKKITRAGFWCHMQNKQIEFGRVANLLKGLCCFPFSPEFPESPSSSCWLLPGHFACFCNCGRSRSFFWSLHFSFSSHTSLKNWWCRETSTSIKG